MLAEVALDNVYAGAKELLVRIAPPRKRGRVGEIDDAGIGQRRQHIAERRRGGCGIPSKHIGFPACRLEQVSLAGEFPEQMRVHRHVRIFPYADAHGIRLHLGERGRGIAEALRVPAKIEPRLHVPRRPAVESEHVDHSAFDAKGPAASAPVDLLKTA